MPVRVEFKPRVRKALPSALVTGRRHRL